MEVQELEKLIQQGEGLKIEFKEAADTVPKSFYETVVSFSNTDGGSILLGITDSANCFALFDAYLASNRYPADFVELA